MEFPRIASSAERMVYRAAGLPVALKVLLVGAAADPLRQAFASRYWHPDGAWEYSELFGGLLLWPLGLLIALAYFTWLNGGVIRRSHGKGVIAQLGEQLRLYFSAGVLPPWYYIFSLHDDGRARAATFIQRFETKPCYFQILKRRRGTPLTDKRRFAEFCAARDIRSVPTLVFLDGKQLRGPLPDADLFVKPNAGRGGRGAERWDCTGPSTFTAPDGDELPGGELLRRLVERSRHRPLIVQLRMCPHRELRAMTAEALPTVRVVTCQNADGEPEVMAAVMRSSVGSNRTVDNLHAGGIAALVDLDRGTLSKASNLGSDAHVGWYSTHPETGAKIEGRALPHWADVMSIAVQAHRAFSDRVVVGWDIAILDDGPIVVEGNGNPDLDILQRFMRVGLREHRFGHLLAHHLASRSLAPTLKR